MAVTMADPVWLDARTVRLAWSSDEEDPTYYVWRDGALVATTEASSMDFTLSAGEVLTVDVFDDSADVQSNAWPGRLTLNWFDAGDDVDYFRCEEYSGGEWVERAQLSEDGRGYYQWTTRFLEDVTEHQFRIVPVGTNGNDGTPQSFTCLMVRQPDTPDVDYSYSDATDKVTVSAA